MCLCAGVCVWVCITQTPGGPPLDDYGMEVSEAHDDIQRDRRAQVVPIQTQVPELGYQCLVTGFSVQVERAELSTVDVLDAVVVEVQLFQVGVEDGHGGQLVVGQVQVHQSGHVEHCLRHAFVTQLVVVQPDKGQVLKVLEVVLGDVVDAVPV